MGPKPEWFDEWVIVEPDNWHLKKGAPDEIKKEFEEFMKDDDCITAEDEED